MGKGFYSGIIKDYNCKGVNNMKKTHKVERFIYSKDLTRDDMQFFGIHPISGRIHIDTKRYKKILEKDGIKEFIPDGLFKNRNTVYFIPNYRSRYDYKFNLFYDMINELKTEWQEEYKPLFKYIKTPGEVYENTRLGEMAYTSCADDLDEIEMDAMFASLKRENKYKHIITSLYCTFISKVSTEIDRIMLNVCIEAGYKSNDFNYSAFVKFSDGIQQDKAGKKLERLNKYNAFNMLHKINNFLKHNTITAYEDLKKWYPRNVRSIENKNAEI